MPPTGLHSPDPGQVNGQFLPRLDAAAARAASGASTPEQQHELMRRIDAALPQTQCSRCGQPDCAHYARAIAFEGEPINQCAPGGVQGIARLAAITGQSAQPLNPRFGIEGPLTIARIEEAHCIGCTLCIKACPVDAIVGAPKRMHTVARAHCTGCELCIPACPVDCIVLDIVDENTSGWDAWSEHQAQAARNRYARHRARWGKVDGLLPPASEHDHEPSAAAPASLPQAPSADDPKKAAIAAALARARALRQK